MFDANPLAVTAHLQDLERRARRDIEAQRSLRRPPLMSRRADRIAVAIVALVAVGFGFVGL